MPATTQSQDGRAQSEGCEHNDPEQLNGQSSGHEEMEEIEARESWRVERRRRSIQDACDSIAAKMSKVWQCVRAIESSPMAEQAQAELSAALNAVEAAGIPRTAIPLYPVSDAELLEAILPAERETQIRSYRLREYCGISHNPDGNFDSESDDDSDDEFVVDFDELHPEPTFKQPDEAVKLGLTAMRSVPNAYLRMPNLAPDKLRNKASVAHYYHLAIHPASEGVVDGILGRGSMRLRQPSGKSLEELGGGAPDEVQFQSIGWGLLRPGTIYVYMSPGTLKEKHFKNNHPAGIRILVQVRGNARALQARSIVVADGRRCLIVQYDLSSENTILYDERPTLIWVKDGIQTARITLANIGVVIQGYLDLGQLGFTTANDDEAEDEDDAVAERAGVHETRAERCRRLAPVYGPLNMLDTDKAVIDAWKCDDL